MLEPFHHTLKPSHLFLLMLLFQGWEGEGVEGSVGANPGGCSSWPGIVIFLASINQIPPKLRNPILNLPQYEGDPNHPDEDGRLGYLQDPTVPKGSTCPTFASAVLRIKNERWGQGDKFWHILAGGDNSSYDLLFVQVGRCAFHP